MNQLHRHAILLSLTERLRELGSWCGETHYILYKHGPYSFELKDELTARLGDHLLTVKPANPYGAHLYPSEDAAAFLARFPNAREKYAVAVEAVARKLGPKSVKDLERCATALYVLLNNPLDSSKKQATEIHRIKSHVTLVEAKAALEEVQVFIGQAKTDRG